jgi:hypothetical protein
MEKNFLFNSGETVDIKQGFNIEEGVYINQMTFTGLDNETKDATMSFQREEDRDAMYEKFDIIAAEGFANFIKG